MTEIPQTQKPFSGFQIGIFFFFIALSLSRIYADYLWFDSLEYSEVFFTALWTKIGLGIAIFALFFIFLFANIKIASQKTKSLASGPLLAISLGISLLAGFLASSFWFLIPRFSHSIPFGFVDPLFENDISFYMMELSFYHFAIGTLAALVLCAIAITFFAYLSTQKIRRQSAMQTPEQITQIAFVFPKKGKEHLIALFGMLLLLASCFFYLKRYSILFGHRGAVYGAGFTDIHVMLPLYLALCALSLVAALVSFSYFRHQNNQWVLLSSLSVLGVLFLGLLCAGLVQTLYVTPNEFNLEQPYLRENIKHTLFAYKLTDVAIRDFPVTYNLTLKDIEKNRAALENVRVWDWRPLLTTYRQLQLFRTYYDFTDVDIDRYTLDGEIRQIMLSAREMDQSQLDSKAKTWVNEKFTYTHGYGAVASPVNLISAEGLPDLYVQDIPPKTLYEELDIDVPQVYFGEQTSSFVIVNTKNQEFDYPLGADNVFTTYNGSDGIALDSLFKKLIFSVKLGSLNIMISSGLTPESKVLFKRNIVERVQTLAPFLEYDSDPYLVISEGRMYWMIDAYTTSNRFPYSEPIFGLNYVRNSVKAVVDAYHGTVAFYVIDSNDPLISNYRAIFPTLFKDFSEMPKDLQSHIRYPEDLFSIQNTIFGTYHMKEPQIFYNKEDVWVTPKEIYDKQEIEMEPYFIILDLPGEQESGFYLIRPLIPRGKDNMIAWMAAHSDPQNYGTLEVFRLSKQELIYGPMQIEARINQDTDIAQLFTLWGQQGSQVIRGNMIVIPIENSFLYIEPVYLKASAAGALPQLKRVVVAYEDKLTMQPTLEEALRVLFGSSTPPPIDPTHKSDEGKKLETLEQRYEVAQDLYEEAENALRAGDFSTFAERIEDLGKILQN